MTPRSRDVSSQISSHHRTLRYSHASALLVMQTNICEFFLLLYRYIVVRLDPLEEVMPLREWVQDHCEPERKDDQVIKAYEFASVLL